MHRRHLTAALALSGALGLAACGGTPTEPAGQPGTAPTSAEPTLAESTTDDPSQDGDPTVDPDPSPTDPQATTGDCSASGLDANADFAGMGGEVANQAQLLLDAATSCDQDFLVTAATEGEAQLTFGDLTPEQFFALPEEGPRPHNYEVVARLLGSTTGTPSPDGDFVIWPAVFVNDSADEHWQELEDSGLYTAEEVAEIRELAEEGNGYLGWRLGISGDGQLQFIVAGD